MIRNLTTPFFQENPVLC